MRKIGRSRADVADTIERFIDGICSRYEWDDFCSVPIIDFHLDAIRMRCIHLLKEFPPIEKGHYCSQAGIAMLRQMVRQLRQPSERNFHR